jgi:hypothetical protein
MTGIALADAAGAASTALAMMNICDLIKALRLLSWTLSNVSGAAEVA